MREFLGFGDWLRWQRQEYRWVPAHVADRGGIPRTTFSAFLSPQRRMQRPRPAGAIQIAAALCLPALTLAVATGHADRQEPGESEPGILGVMREWSRGIADRRTLLWSVVGARYLRAIAESVGLTLSVIGERWYARTGDSLHEIDWDMGSIPDRWTPHKMLDMLPGPALALLVEAFGGDATDVIGVATAMGRIGPELAMTWGVETDYGKWVSVMEEQAWGDDFKKFDAKTYRAAIREIPWTIPDPPEVPAQSRGVSKTIQAAKTPANPEDWAYLLSCYPRLTPGQRSIVRQLIASWLPD